MAQGVEHFHTFIYRDIEYYVFIARRNLRKNLSAHDQIGLLPLEQPIQKTHYSQPCGRIQ